jgi:putative tricarboxylic transport membrane protein
MATGNHVESAPSRARALLEVVAAALIACAAGGLGVAMPALVAESAFDPPHDFIQLTPLFFPRLTFGVLAVLALVYLAQALHALRFTAAGKQQWWDPKYNNVIAMTVLAALYFVLLDWLGFTVSTAVMTVAMAALVGGGRWWHVACLALLAPVTIRFVFERLLLISLPRSELDWIADREEALMQLLVRVFT